MDWRLRRLRARRQPVRGSRVGDDANPCSRTAPCKTFAGAISKTAAGGEIDALDPGGFGTLTITKAITIDGGAGLASVLGTGTNGINVNAGAGDVVTIRNLSVNGTGAGINGIQFLAGHALHVENVTVMGFTDYGINVNLPAAALLIVENTTITQCGAGGIGILSTAAMPAELKHVRIWNCVVGVDAQNGARITLRNSEVSLNSTAGVRLTQAGQLSEANIDSTSLNYNGAAVLASAGTTARITNNTIINNGTGLSPGGGIIVSGGDNTIIGNVTDGLPTSTLVKR